jgi:hypothetical protein
VTHYEKIPDLLDNLLTCSMAEASRRVGISPRLPWHWMVQSRLGHPDLQAVEFCGVTAPFHIQCQNAKTLMAQQIEQSAIERARDGCYVDVFFQGVRQYEKKLKDEYKDIPEDELWLTVGPDWEKVCYETVPTKQWLKPSDALVLKMVESWNRRRYGAHQTIDVTYGGVLRLERPEERTAVIENRPEVFEDEDTDAAEKGGHHLALARPANTSEEMDKWAEQGEFAPAPVTFVNAKGERTELRADVEALRTQAAELKRLGPVHKRPEGKVEVFKPDDEPRKEPEKPEPIPQTLADHPRADYVDKLSPPRRPPPYGGADVGSGREGLGRGPNPERDGRHQGFRMTKV